MGRNTRHQNRSLDRIADGLDALSPGQERPTDRARTTAEVVSGRVKLPMAARVRLFFGGSEKRSSEAREARRSFPIMGYVGPNGGGKSLAMVHDTLPSLDAGRTVYSTVSLPGFASYVPLTTFDQLLEAEHCDVLFDEVVGIASARGSMSLPMPVQNLLVQLRRRDIVLRWTAPNWLRADKIIREVTQAVTECRGHFPSRGVVTEGGNRLWAPNRVFQFRTFDTIEFEDWTAGKREKLTASAKEWFRGVGSRAFASYDTLDSVAMVSNVMEGDLCPYCGKHRRREYCKGHTDADIAALQHPAGPHFEPSEGLLGDVA